MNIHRIAGVLFLSVAVAAAQPQTKATPSFYGTFSSLSLVKESGDVIGFEVTVLPQSGRPYAVFQCAEGSPAEPALTPLTVRGNHVSFTLPNTAACAGDYVAEITTRGLVLRAAAWTKSETLPRRSSYWSHRH